ncbi:hypothetical protein Q7P37_008914 [Cladosporium fusiforme]
MASIDVQGRPGSPSRNTRSHNSNYEQPAARAPMEEAMYTEGYRRHNYSEPSNNRVDVDMDDSTNFKDNAYGDEEDDGDAGEAKDRSRRDRILDRGADNLQYSRVENGVKEIPIEAANIIQKASHVYRQAWYKGKAEVLVRTLHNANAALFQIPIDQDFITAHTKFGKRTGKKEREYFINSFKMNDGLIDVIIQIAHDLDEWHKMSKGPEQTKKAHGILMTIFGQRRTIYEMGLTFKSIIEPDLMEDVAKVLNMGMPLTSTNVKEELKLWLEGDDRAPTCVQQHSATKAPAIINDIFQQLEKKQPVQQGVKELQAIQESLTASNKSMNFRESDHALGLEMVSQSVRKLAKVADHSYHSSLQEMKLRYAILLAQQGWRFMDEIPSFQFAADAQQRLNDARSQSMITGYTPVDAEADSQQGEPDIASTSSNATSQQEPGPTNTEQAQQENRPDAARAQRVHEPEAVHAEQTAQQQQQQQQRQSTQQNTATQNGSEPTGFSNCSFGSMDCDRTTELGYIVGGRHAGGEGRSRQIINIGTFKNPVYRVVWGGCFGRKNNLVEKFPLPYPDFPREARNRKSEDIIKVDKVVQLDWVKETKRQPVTYYRIIWKVADSEPMWLTRSDLISFKGKKWLEDPVMDVIENGTMVKKSRHDKLMACWKSDLRYVEISKSKGLNPSTGQPLGEDDEKEMPWLACSRITTGPTVESQAQNNTGGEETTGDEFTTELGGSEFPE